MTSSRGALARLLGVAWLGLVTMNSVNADENVPVIEWTPAKVSETLANGEASQRVVTLTSGKSLQDVRFRVARALRPFVSVSPSAIPKISAGIPQQISLEFAVSPIALSQIVNGRVRVRGRKLDDDMEDDDDDDDDDDDLEEADDDVESFESLPVELQVVSPTAATVTISTGTGEAVITVNGVDIGAPDSAGFASLDVPSGEVLITVIVPGVSAGFERVLLEAGIVTVAEVELSGEHLPFFQEYELVLDSPTDGKLSESLPEVSFRFVDPEARNIRLEEIELVSVHSNEPTSPGTTFIEEFFNLQNDGTVLLLDTVGMRDVLSAYTGVVILSALGRDPDGALYEESVELQLVP